MKYLLLFLFFASSLQTVEGKTVSRVSTMTWDGISMYIPVDKDKVQQKLDDYHGSFVKDCNRPTLFLPDVSVFPGILNETQHVLYVDIGIATSLDFEGYPDTGLDLKGVEMSVTIPFLSSSSSDLPHYSLALAQFYDRTRGEIATPNIAFPYIPLDEISMEDDLVVIRNDSDEFLFSFTRYNDPCIPPTSIIRHEFENFTKYDMQIGSSEPNFHICDIYPYKNNLCSTFKEIRCDVSRFTPNFCQLPWETHPTVACKTSIQIVNITSGFRDFMLLNENPINIIASESLSGYAQIGIKYPCIE